MTPPKALAAAPPPEPKVPAPRPRPAKLDRAIWLNMLLSPAITASGAAARLAGSAEASIRICGAAWVQPFGTDMLPTNAARPIDADAALPVRLAPGTCA